jgi:antitoxin (DNA-binding transcriptional repressor) of toxin-antitoxin stability system
MKMVNLQAAKANWSALVEEAASGKEIIIAKAGKPVARFKLSVPPAPVPERMMD